MKTQKNKKKQEKFLWVKKQKHKKEKKKQKWEQIKALIFYFERNNSI